MNCEIKTSVPESGNIWNLFLTSGWNDEYKINKDEYFNAVNESKYMVTAYDEEKLIGCGRVVADGVLHAMIYDLIVLPEYQGMGVGTIILDKLITMCRANNIRDIQLFSAKGKKEYYEKRGFSARPDNGPRMDYKPKQV